MSEAKLQKIMDLFERKNEPDHERVQETKDTEELCSFSDLYYSFEGALIDLERTGYADEITMKTFRLTAEKLSQLAMILEEEEEKPDMPWYFTSNSTKMERAGHAIAALRMPHYSFKRVPNTVRQATADIIESLITPVGIGRELCECPKCGRNHWKLATKD